MEASDTPSMHKTKYLVSLGAYDGNLFGVQLNCNLNFAPTSGGKKFTKKAEEVADQTAVHSQKKSDEIALTRGFYSKSKYAFKAMEGSIR